MTSDRTGIRPPGGAGTSAGDPNPLADGTAFRHRVIARLTGEGAAGSVDPDQGPRHGDRELDPGTRAPDTGEILRPAAVLIPVVARDDTLDVIFTVRAEHLASHAGQISFPGGKIEPGDSGPADAALRESEEEIGLARDFVEVLGRLDPFRTGTGFCIEPIVGLVRPGFTLVADRGEVADIFEVPLAFLMDPANLQRHAREWRGSLRTYYAIPYGERVIWGATAGIVKNLYERLMG